MTDSEPLDVRIEPAGRGDAEAVADVILASRRTFLGYAPLAHTEPEVRAWVGDTLLPSCRVLLARAGPEVVGVIALAREDDVDWIEQCYVAPGFTGRGVGTTLLDAALPGLDGPVRLWTFQRNAGARRFYERHGFEVVRMTDGRDNEERCPDVLYERPRQRSVAAIETDR